MLIHATPRPAPRPTTEPVSVVILSGALGLGGAEQQLFNFLQGLPRSRWTPSVIALRESDADAWGPRIRDLDVPLHVMSAGHTKRRRLAVLVQLLKDRRAQIVHSWLLFFNPLAYLAGSLAGVPVRLGSVREGAHAFLGERAFRWISHASLDALVVNSRTSAANAPPLTPARAAVRVVPNGVRLDDCATPEEALAFRARLGCTPETPIVGAVGRLNDNKNFAAAIRAFRAVSHRHPHAVLVIVGDGREREALQRLAVELDVASRVILAGPIPGVARYFGTFRLLCHTSRREGMSNVLLEAAAHGIPVVATRAGAAGEVVEDGVTGHLVDQDDDAAAAGYLDRLLADEELADGMGSAARRRVADLFPVAAMVSGITRFYDDALAGTLGRTPRNTVGSER